MMAVTFLKETVSIFYLSAETLTLFNDDVDPAYQFSALNFQISI